MAINKPPRLYRAFAAKDSSAKPKKVYTEGGKFGAGYVEDFAVITRGEALGHGLWLDRTFITQVAQQLEANEGGVKSRFTHPNMSGDGLAKGLGRVYFNSFRNDVVRGDLHFWTSARKSPDGDLGGFVLERAQEDPDSFGASIAFEWDQEASDRFNIEHGAELKSDPWFGEYLDFTNFKSPDPDNHKNLPHVRLKTLSKVDFVEDPAANPSGLFQRDENFKEAEALLEYALGLSDKRPELVNFDVDPDRVGGFVQRFLETKGIQMSFKLKNLNDGGAVENEPKEEGGVAVLEPTQEATSEATEPAGDTPATSQEAEPAGAPATPQLSSRDECKRFLGAFGDKGAKYFADGLTFEEAQSKHIADVTSELSKAKEEIKKLSAMLNSGERPLSSSGGDERQGEKTRAGFASRIRLPGSK